MELRRITWCIFIIGSLSAIIDADDNGQGVNDAIIQHALELGRNVVDRAIAETTTALFGGKPASSSDLLRLFRFPTPEVVEIARADETFHAALDIIKDYDGIQSTVGREGHVQPNLREKLTDRNIRDIITLSGCKDVADVTCHDSCAHAKYRSINGSCNNLEKPTQGAALTPFARLLPPKYDNRFNEPVGWQESANPLPSPRLVSRVVGSTDDLTDDGDRSAFVMLWGQFFDHDINHTPQSPSSVAFNDGTKCSETCENSFPCFPIPVPAGDPRIHTECLEFIRSSAMCGTGYKTRSGRLVPRQQINSITSYIDGSQIYGSSQRLADNLRAHDGKGSLRINDEKEVPTGRPLLPFDPESPPACLSESSSREVPCFLAGDVRANEQVGLTSIHTLFLREHNRISERLSQLNPHWDDEKLYQEARKIVGAVLQHITYDHYLPKVLGPEGMLQLGDYQGYDASADASIANVFATAAFRFGHGTVQPILQRLQANLQPIPEGNLPLHLAFFQPWRLVEQGGIDPILRGFFATPAKQLIPDEIMTDELTERLFEMAEAVALDLMALNIQRGRDHGLPSYTQWRQKCGMRKHSFRQMGREISDEHVMDKLKELYDNPSRIDLFIGAMAEDALQGGILGATFTCLLATQFKNSRAGDRFWYEKPDVFTESQLAEIKKHSLARIICENTDINQVQEDVFLTPKNNRPLIDCSELDNMDLSLWAEPTGGPTPPTITCPGDITVDGNRKGATATWEDPLGTDSTGSAADVTCSHTSGSNFPLGVTPVTCSTFDLLGNCASCSFEITVD